MRRRLFVHTTVFVGAYREAGSAEDELLESAALGDFTVVLSQQLVDESLRVVQGLYGQRAASTLRATLFEFPSLRFVGSPEWERMLALLAPYVRDPSDGPHFAAARAGRADALVTHNRRSVLPGMFEFVPIVAPETILPAVRGDRAWPKNAELLAAWNEWARTSPRAPRKRKTER